MPNICENYVKIRGDRSTLERLLAVHLDMDELVPAPVEMTRGSEEWWAWIRENWSTKWISNDTRDGPPVIVDHGEYIESHFISAWFFPFAFYQGLVRKWPELLIDYQYSCWETGFIGFGSMMISNVEEEPTHCSYNTPEELNQGISLLTEGRWKVWTGNPHFEYDEVTGLYNWDMETRRRIEDEETIGLNEAVAEADSTGDEGDMEPIVIPTAVCTGRVIKKCRGGAAPGRQIG
jgi:hypothetical protein